MVHFAAESHVDRSIAGAEDFVKTNVVGTQTLLDAALRHGLDRFVHVSTDEVYGSIESGSWTEDQPLEPNSPYSASKAGSDLLARAFFRTHGLDVRVTRCSNNYGPYQFPEKVIPLFVTNLVDGLNVPLYGDGGNIRDWLHVDDHCRALHLVLAGGRAGEVYNIGGGTELTNKELTERLLAPPTPAGTGSSRCPTGSGTTGATRWTGPRSTPSSATNPPGAWTMASPRPCGGTPATATGGNRSSSGESRRGAARVPQRSASTCFNHAPSRSWSNV